MEISPKLPILIRRHPAAENPKKGLIAVLAIIIAGIGGAWYVEHIAGGIFSVVFLFVGLARFFLPTDYAIDNTGISEKFLGAKKIFPWRRFKRAEKYGTMVIISPYATKNFMDNFRALTVDTGDESVAVFIVQTVTKGGVHV